MEIGISLLRHIKVEDHIDLFNINTSTEYVCWHHDPVLELFEVIVPLYSLRLQQISVDRDAGEVILSQDFVQFDGVEDALHEDNDLIEHEWV